MRLDLHPEARAELRSAALWYEERRPGLGDELVTEVFAAFVRIRDHPESYGRWPGTRDRALIRRCPIERFPYVVAFQRHGESVLVLAIAHAKRRPLYWLTRVTV